MRTYQHEFDEGPAERTQAARVDAPNGETGRAVAAGRPDALGQDGLLRLQRLAGNSSVGMLVAQRSEDEDPAAAQADSVRSVVTSGGQPLDRDTRTDMEARLGHDFGDVRVHTGGDAHDSARSLGADAYTVGSSVVFQRDAYDPSSGQGRETLAHELTHVVQQRSGPVDGTPAGGGISVSDPSDRFEREAASNAARVMAEPAPAATPASGAVQRHAAEDEIVQGSFEHPAVQRQEDGVDPLPLQRDETEEPEEEETVQGSFEHAAVQRQEEELEEEPTG